MSCGADSAEAPSPAEVHRSLTLPDTILQHVRLALSSNHSVVERPLDADVTTVLDSFVHDPTGAYEKQQAAEKVWADRVAEAAPKHDAWKRSLSATQQQGAWSIAPYSVG